MKNLICFILGRDFKIPVHPIFSFLISFILIFSKPLCAEAFVVCSSKEHNLYSRVDGSLMRSVSSAEGTMKESTLLTFKISENDFEVIDNYCNRSDYSWDNSLLRGFILNMTELYISLTCVDRTSDDEKWHWEEKYLIDRVTGEIHWTRSYPTKNSSYKSYSIHMENLGNCEVTQKKF